MTQKTKNKTQNVAYVHNPSVDFIVGGEGKRKNPMKSKNSSNSSSKGTSQSKKNKGKKKNPGAVPVGKKTNPNRKNNPDKITTLFGAALIAGLGVSLFDAGLNRIAPTSSGTIRAGIKLGGAYAIQTWGSKIPFVKDFHKDIALVLAVLGIVDIFQMHILPLINGATGGALNFLSPANYAAEMSGNYTYQALPAYEDEDEYVDIDEDEYAYA